MSVCAYRGDQQIFHYLLHSEDLIQHLNPSMSYMNILHINTVQPWWPTGAAGSCISPNVPIPAPIHSIPWHLQGITGAFQGLMGPWEMAEVKGWRGFDLMEAHLRRRKEKNVHQMIGGRTSYHPTRHLKHLTDWNTHRHAVCSSCSQFMPSASPPISFSF